MAEIKILFVDDELGVLKALKRACFNRDWSVTIIESAIEALDLLEQSYFNVIVSDMRMPQMNGAEFLSKARLIQPRAVRILLTGFSDDTDTAQAINEGKIFSYLHKPIANEELIKTIETALEFRKSEMERLRLQRLLWDQNKTLKGENTDLIEDNKQRTAEVQQGLLIMQTVNNQLRNNLDSTIDLLKDVVEMRETYTKGHSKRISNYCMSLAKEAKLSEEELQQLQIASSLHDIGTLGFAEDLTSKAFEFLSKKHQSIYKQHPIFGQSILKKAAGLEKAALYVRQHHEYLDGTGYPDGLKAEEISIGARIICLCSEFDSIVCGRTFKQLYTVEQAIELLHKEKGKKYDLSLTQAFIDLLQKGEISSDDQVRTVQKHELQPGMVLSHDLETDMGVILLSKDSVLNEETIINIVNYERDINHHLHIQVKIQN
ncbi:MAG: response regulator [Saccharospirillaceae bacterium]|nr:response regulator [Pseudomonadales bacterium]NRB77809.1 response regulator [Saccharospirillaceae bacterium]